MPGITLLVTKYTASRLGASFLRREYTAGSRFEIGVTERSMVISIISLKIIKGEGARVAGAKLTRPLGVAARRPEIGEARRQPLGHGIGRDRNLDPAQRDARAEDGGEIRRADDLDRLRILRVAEGDETRISIARQKRRLPLTLQAFEFLPPINRRRQRRGISEERIQACRVISSGGTAQQREQGVPARKVDEYGLAAHTAVEGAVRQRAGGASPDLDDARPAARSLRCVDDDGHPIAVALAAAEPAAYEQERHRDRCQDRTHEL